MAHKDAERRGSEVMNRLRSMRSSIAPVAPIDVTSDADAANEESGFSSVVRLGAHGPRLAMRPLASDALRPKARFSHCRLTGKARHRRCLRMPKRARSSIRRSQSPLQLPRRWARLRMTLVMSEVNLRCRTLHNGGMLLCALPYGTLRTCAGPSRSERQRQRSSSTCECNATRTRATLVCLAGYIGIDPCSQQST